MKILHLSTFDRINGASIAAYRLHQGLLQSGVDSAMWVQNKVSADPTIFGPAPGLGRFWNRCRPWLDRMPLAMAGAFGNYLVSAGWLPRMNTGPMKEWRPDVLHIHWVQGGFIPVHLLRRLQRFGAGLRLPVFWTFHDEWPFSGVRHYGSSALDWEGGKLLKKWDDRLRRCKANIYCDVKPVGIAPSSWMANRARASEVWKDHRVEVLPNPIDTEVFQPGCQKDSRKKLRLPSDIPLVLFGAEAGALDRRKGFDLLREACRILSERKIRFGLVCFGNGSPGNLGEIPCFSLGWINEDVDLVTAYAAADVVALPSRMDNLPNTGVEAAACGRPVVSFSVGGIPDIVEDRQNGFLCLEEDSEALADRIELLLSDNALRIRMGKTARKKAEENFSSEKLIPKFTELYESSVASLRETDE